MDGPIDRGADRRRRKLDELFADEPFLSPTMKARMLHERAGRPAAAPPFPREAFVSGKARTLGAGRYTLRQAAAVLRSGEPPEDAALARLRVEVLERWRRHDM